MYNFIKIFTDVFGYVINKAIMITYTECLDIYYGTRIFQDGSYGCILSDDRDFIDGINSMIDNDYRDINIEAYSKSRMYKLILVDYKYILGGKTSSMELYNNLCDDTYTVVIIITPKMDDIDIIYKYGKGVCDYGELTGRNVHISYVITPYNTDDLHNHTIKLNSNIMDGIRCCLDFPITKYKC